MASLTDLRSTIQVALAQVAELNAYAYVPGQVNTPAAIVMPDNVAYDVTFEGGATYVLPVQFLVSQADWESAQLILDALISHDGAAVAAIDNAPGIDAQVQSMSQYGLVEYGGTEYLGARLFVEVLV